MQFANVYLQQLRSVISTNRIFYAGFAIVWLAGLLIQLSFAQFGISSFINGLHTSLGDVVMTYTTYAGDGFFLVFIGILISFLNRKYWLVTLLSLTIPSAITQLLKHFVFADSHRPAVLMSDIPGLHYVEGVFINQFNSFPSGHTTAAFSLYTLIALLQHRKNMGWMWVVIAASVAVSRVYLLQHFWIDILAGSILAVVQVTFIYTFFAAKLQTYENTTTQ
jgi:membrane-associated phospholipid phosphatase